ncbi:major facilitator superfamily domain-containing protein [Circinella umbellata]|nr:major facilitator superfamily domain-containing protein [Circinella umbellata]
MGTSFDALYTASYITSHPGIKRSTSDTFLFQRSRERQARQREEERQDLLRDHNSENESNQEERHNLSLLMLFCLTLCMSGVQFTWTVELAYGTPYLLSFELSKDVTALVWLIGPLSGLIMQPVIGSLSDRCSSRLGRRRPFIIAGGINVCLSMLGVAYAKDLGSWLIRLSNHTTTPENMAEQERRAAIVVAIFSFYLLDFSLNAVQASCRALILDIPPLWQQQQANAWAARLSNVAMVIGYFTGFVDLINLFPFMGDTQIKVFCLVAIGVFIITVGTTCLTIKEETISIYDQADNDSSHWYYTFTHIWDTLRHLPKPVQKLCNVQFFAWLGWFPFLFYSTTWVSDLYFVSHPRDSPDSWAKGTRAGSFALLMYAIVSVVSGVILPWLVAHKPCCGSFFTMKNIFTVGNFLFAICMLSTILISNVVIATLVVAIIGISWGVVLWIPFALVGEYIMAASALPPTPFHGNTPEAGISSNIKFTGTRNRETNENKVSRHPSSSSSVPAPNYGATVSSYISIPDKHDIIGHSSSERRLDVLRPGQQDPTDDEEDIRSIIRQQRDEFENELDAGMVLGVHNIYIVSPQFLVAFVSAIIFRIVNWVEENGKNDEQESDTANVAWVLMFGGVMSLIATILCRRIVEVPSNITNVIDNRCDS